MSLAITYAARTRNDGTALFSMDALKRGLGYGEDLRRYDPHGTIPDNHELYISVDDGMDAIDPTAFEWIPPHPNAFWAVDAHLGYENRLKKASHYDYVFCAQKRAVEEMRRDGIQNVHWLPLACAPPPSLGDQGAHCNVEEILMSPGKDEILHGGNLEKAYDIGFCGFMNEDAEGNNRVDFLDALYKAYPDSWLSVNRFFEEMSMVYIRARLGFNVSIRDDLNMRFFEILSTGTCMLTNTDCDGYEDLGFFAGEDFVGYEGIDGAIEQAGWALDHPEECKQIAASGHAKVRAGHTYIDRMQQLLEICGVKVPEKQEA